MRGQSHHAARSNAACLGILWLAGCWSTMQDTPCVTYLATEPGQCLCIATSVTTVSVWWSTTNVVLSAVSVLQLVAVASS